MKEQLDWVIMNLQAGGFWQKWNSEMFNSKVEHEEDGELSNTEMSSLDILTTDKE